MSDAAPTAQGRGALHWIIVLVVFSITGSLAVVVARVILHDLLGLTGSFWGGPWSYRVVYLLLIPPCYSVMLVTIGALFGKLAYFRLRVLKMWSRILPGSLGRKLAVAAREAAEQMPGR